MEIVDFYKESRKVVFNLDKKRDYNKAIKTLTPKGLKKRRRKNSKSNQKLIQRTITETIDSFLNIDLPKIIPDENLKTNKKIEDTKNQINIEDNLIQQFGSGGNLEVICPFCQDTINFEYYNLDERKNKATRICSCEAITRISIRGFNKKIFSDIGITSDLFNRYVQKTENDIQDEFGNIIYTYSFKILI
jgi:hypothetical protein